MSSDDVMISAEGLAKRYRIQHNTTDHVTLAELLVERLRHPFRRAEREDFWALTDVNFDVHRGEVLGLIGRNGAGKSTLLKVLNRVTHPTAGRVSLWGRVGSLLEVGTGFHPELTGRENVYLNGAILGMARKEIEGQFDAIVDFAGVERFLDTPVKRYSSGMQVRLAFAVAAHLQSEILLIDEVLAVGDQEFQERCISRVHDVAQTGRAVIMVSHNMVSVRQFSDRCLLLDRGRVSAFGGVEDVVAVYEDQDHAPRVATFEAQGSATRACNLLRATAEGGSALSCGARIPILLDIDVIDTAATGISVGATVNSGTRPVGTTVSSVELPHAGPQKCSVELAVESDGLAPGDYTLSIGVGVTGEAGAPVADHVVANALRFSLSPSTDSEWLLRNWNAEFGVVRLGASTRLLGPAARRGRTA